MADRENIFRIANLNCWALPQPWPIGSLHVKYRINKLIEALNDSIFDVVTLQEIWSESDFLRISESVKLKFPFCHYFHSGFTGSGACIFSIYPIASTLTHRYSLNGFPHHIHRGDWFGGKIVGMAELKVQSRIEKKRSLRVHVYTTHLHAEYNNKHDLYLPHRISQCFELAQFVRHTSQKTDFVVVSGDFNVEPSNLGYHLITSIAQLSDAWACKPNCDDLCGGATSERPDNCFTSRGSLKESPNGKRIDYIMFRSGSVGMDLLDCNICFDKISEPKPMNYSDHAGLSATFLLKSDTHSDSSSERLQHIAFEKMFIEKSLEILEEGLKRVLWDRCFFLVICFILVALIAATATIEFSFPYVTILIAIFRFLLTVFISFSLWHGLIGLTIEMKALKETKYSMRKILKHDLCES